MKIGIVDADLIGRKKHRFPNLVCEKLAGYWKEKGADVTLLMDYDHFEEFDHVYVSKVFTDTPVPKWLTETETVHIGGTGFYFDKAPNLPDEIEHHMPDYRLYDEWIEAEVEKARTEYTRTGRHFNERSYRVQFKEYTDYCIGFITRGCFRKCKFCVNQKFDHVFTHSPLEEFYYEGCKKICLLDDNFLGCPQWKELLQKLIDIGKPFKFKQGLDERLLTEEKCEMLFNANYDGDYTFAFDNIADYDLIHKYADIVREILEAGEDKRHWSYYEEYLKNAPLKKYRQTNPDIDDTVAEAIKTDAIREAADMRKLGQIAAVGDKQTKKIMQQIADGTIDLYEGYETVEDAGKLDDVVKKLKAFKKIVSEPAFEKQVISSDETMQQARFEIGKIIKRLTAIQAKLEK